MTDFDEFAGHLDGTERRYGHKEDKLDTTTSVIRKSKLPVLVIKLTEDEMVSPSRRDKFCHRLFSKVLYPTATDCEPCVKIHTHRAKKLGAINEEVAETIGVATVMLADCSDVWPRDTIMGELEKLA